MSSDLDLLEIQEEQRQKHRQRLRDKKSHRREVAESHRQHKSNRLPLVSDPFDDYFEYYLPPQSRCSGRLKPHKRSLRVLEYE